MGHFQTVHHDLWDYDIPLAPKLMTITKDGKDIPVVVQATKQGFIFVLDRKTGVPIWPVEERPVPQSDVPGEKTSPTQPFPTWPEPFTRQGKITEADINPLHSRSGQGEGAGSAEDGAQRGYLHAAEHPRLDSAAGP